MNLKFLLPLTLVAALVACSSEKDAPTTPTKPAATAQKPANPINGTPADLPAAPKAITLKVDGMS